MRRLRELYQLSGGLGVVRATRRSVQPKLFAEDLALPVGPFGLNHDRIPVSRNPYIGEADGVEEFIESQLGLCVLCLGKVWLDKKGN